MLLKPAPAISSQEAAEIASAVYGLRASASELPSERDQNFLLQADTGRFVLKMSNATDDRAILDAQNAAMDHVASLTALAPKVISVGGESIFAHERGAMRHFVRLLTWIDGEPLAAVPRQSPQLLEDVGRRLGDIDRALSAFDHPAVHRTLHWDVARGATVVREHAPRIADAGIRRRIESWTADVATRLDGRLASLRRSVIHNDANDYNVLVSTAGDVWFRYQRVAGVIDYGDIVHSLTIADLAIAMAYVMLDKSDPLAAGVSLVRGYHRAWPLDEAELGVLLDLSRLRLCNERGARRRATGAAPRR